MPGILYHLSFAEEVYRRIAQHTAFDKIDFMAGNLIPDLALDKQKSHYRKKASVDGFFVPDMEPVMKDLLDLNDAVKFGMLCHLYLDYRFIEGYLIPEFIWDTETQTVKNYRNGKTWSVDTFFSHDGMYGAYTEINRLLVKDGHISFEMIEKIPEILPRTGMPVFDARRGETWKEELQDYLVQEKEYTGEIFDYERMWDFMERAAAQFVEEVLR